MGLEHLKRPVDPSRLPAPPSEMEDTDDLLEDAEDMVFERAPAAPGESREEGSNGGEPNEEDTKKKESFMTAARSKRLRPFVIISSSYLLYTITDGAIRMIVLLHAYNKNFSALEVAIMFTLYELAGVFTNLVSICVCLSGGAHIANVSD